MAFKPVLIFIVLIVQVATISLAQKGIFGKAIAKINEGDTNANLEAKQRIVKHIENMEKA
jgi:hypothetical protein